MKKLFTNPEISAVELEQSDVIMVSGEIAANRNLNVVTKDNFAPQDIWKGAGEGWI